MLSGGGGGGGGGVMVLNATFNNISVISWRIHCSTLQYEIYIMYNVQDCRVLYDKDVRPVIC